MWGISYPGFYAAAGHDRRASGAQGRLAAGADRRLVRRRRLPPQRRALPAARVQLLSPLRPCRARSRRRRAPDRVRPRHARRLRASSSTLGPLANADAKYFKGEVAFWNDVMAARDLRRRSGRRATCGRTCKNIKPAVMTVGGWFDAEDLFGALETYRCDRAAEPGRRQHARDGPVVPRRLGAPRRRPSLGDVRFGAKTASYYRGQIELPFFRSHLKGTSDDRACRSASCSRPAANQWRAPAALAARRTSTRTDALLPRRRHGSSFEPRRASGRGARTSTSAIRRSRCRSSSDVQHRHDARVHGRGPALRRRAGRTCSSTRREPLEEDLTLAGPIGRRARASRRRAPTPTGS